MNEWKKYSIIALLIILFGIFIYPTLYEYDKLEQQYPVKINRLTGESKILTVNGWVNPGNYDSAATEMRQYRDEIMKKLEVDREQVKQDIIHSIRDEIISNVQSELAVVKEEIEAYKVYELDPENSFTFGDSKDTVKKIMGVADSISKNEFLNQETWFYGISHVTFKNGKVFEWTNNGDNLRTK